MIPKKILFCADFSENSECAKQLALDYAKSFGAKLLVLNVVNTRVLKHPALVDLPVYDEAFKGVEQAAGANLAALGDNCRKQLADVTTHASIGVPADEVLKFADEQAVDLIVMGTHGRTGLGHLLMGSVAETVVRTAQCPVMTVRSKSSK